MIDGTGMCGGCRVTVGNQIKFACVDGPEFDAHEVDFDELAAATGPTATWSRRRWRTTSAASVWGRPETGPSGSTFSQEADGEMAPAGSILFISD